MLKIIIHLDAFGKDSLVGMMSQAFNKLNQASLSTSTVKEISWGEVRQNHV